MSGSVPCMTPSPENHLRRIARIRREATGARSPAKVSGAGQTALTLGFNLNHGGAAPVHKDGPGNCYFHAMLGPFLQATRIAALLPFF